MSGRYSSSAHFYGTCHSHLLMNSTPLGAHFAKVPMERIQRTCFSTDETSPTGRCFFSSHRDD